MTLRAGRLLVEVDADTAGLSQGLRGNAVQDIRRFQSEAEAGVANLADEFRRTRQELDGVIENTRSAAQETAGTVFNLRNFVVGAIATLGVATIARQLDQLTEAAVQSARRIGDIADRSNLSAEGLQTLRFAARQVGLELDAADDATLTFARNVSDAGRSVGSAGRVFNELGISVRNTEGGLRSTGAILNDVANSIAQIDDPVDRLRVTQELFGESNAALVDVLLQGADGLARYGREAQRTGNVLSGDLIDRARDLDIRFQTATESLRTNTIPTLIDLRETFVLLTEAIADVTAGTARFIDNFRALPDQQTITIESNIEGLTTIINDLQRDLAEGEGTALGGLLEQGRVDALNRALVERAELMDELTRRTNAATIAQGDLNDAAGGAGAGTREGLAELRAQVDEQLGRLANLDPATAAQISSQLGQALAEGGNLGTEALLNILRASSQEIGQAIAGINERAQTEVNRRRNQAIAAASALARQEEARQLRAATRLTTAIGRIEAANTASLSPLRAQIDAIDTQVARLRALQAASSDRVDAERAVTLLLEQQARLQGRLDFGNEVGRRVRNQLGGALSELSGLDPAAARQITREFENAIAAAGEGDSLEVIAQEFRRRTIRAINEIRLEDIGTVGEVVGTSVADGLRRAAQGESVNFATVIGDALENRFRDRLNIIFGEVADAFGEKLSDVIDDVLGEDSFIGGIIGDRAGDILGLGVAAFRAFSQDAEVVSRAASDIESAVTNSQVVRGVIAGPTSIPILEASRRLEDANVPVVAQLVRANQFLSQIVVNTGGTTASIEAGVGASPDIVAALDETAALT